MWVETAYCDLYSIVMGFNEQYSEPILRTSAFDVAVLHTVSTPRARPKVMFWPSAMSRMSDISIVGFGLTDFARPPKYPRLPMLAADIDISPCEPNITTVFGNAYCIEPPLKWI